ncbi:FHA domain/Zinc finger, C3HC4 type (RING finger) containing protein [Novymonas esmeraldas]|uniref:E3 ubiquitin-protein ligase CHFR n=1 Tax=Novymonas esmeraldas TaxID=1808958 RepID=A0AAW0ESI5_9TRYP
MSRPASRGSSDGGTPVQHSFEEEANAAADLFDLAAPPLQQPLVARLVPLHAGLPVLSLHQDSGTVVVGRGKDIHEDYRIASSDKLSARHCELLVDPVTLRVELRDVSTNGTFVNGARVAKGERVALQSADRVSLTRPLDAVAEADAQGRVAYIFQRVKAETTHAHMTEELTCSVCRSILHRPCSVLPCMHVFCAGCVSGWVRHDTPHQQHTCPECRGGITDIRPTHRLQSCVERLLLADPASRRPADELAALDAADTVPPSGMKLSKRGRDSSDAEDDFADDHSRDASSGDGDEFIGAVRHAALRFGNPVPLAGPQCSECHTPNAVDGFQCPDSGPHLRCTACRQCFAERPLCGRPQRCHVCNLAFCHMYRAGGCVCGTEMPFKLLREHEPITALPPQTLGGNVLEQGILSTYMASHGALVKDVWATAVAKLAAGEWVPDMTLINGAVTADSPVCQRCAAAVFAELLFHYRRSIAAADLPDSVTRRPNCWYGKECRTQFHKPQHAQNFNHVCYQEKRKE